jgi:hypothetical protein
MGSPFTVLPHFLVLHLVYYHLPVEWTRRLNERIDDQPLSAYWTKNEGGWRGKSAIFGSDPNMYGERLTRGLPVHFRSETTCLP